MTGIMTENMKMTLRKGEESRILYLVSPGGESSLSGHVGGFSVISGNGLNLNMVLEDGARADILAVILPGADTEMTFSMDLAGEGAGCFLSGLYLCPDNEKLSINVLMRHRVPRCTSRQQFRGIVSGTAEARFYGKIIVSQDAQKTEAYQENHNLLLSETAKVDTQPQLEIYADDVKCSHGAAIGKLDENEQFYMRSRGIPEQEARILQMISFLSPVLDILPEGEGREALVSYLENAVRSEF